MKSRTLACAVVLMAVSAVPARAVPTLTFTAPSSSSGAAVAAEAAFLGMLKPGSITETFEGYTASRTTTYDPLATPVGTFDQNSTGSTGGSCNLVNHCVGLAILDGSTSPFSGRFPEPPVVGNDNWLDSNDSPSMTFTVAPGFSAVGFYLTDPNDNGGRLTITGTSGVATTYFFGDIFGTSLASGRISYLTISDPLGIKNVTFLANTTGDGYGIDSVTVGNVPEPGTLLLLGSGLTALALRRRRKA